MLQEQAENLFTADHELELPMWIPFPTRMTVIRIADGSLALISPIPIDDALAAELAALGRVTHLIAPNLLHHLHLEPAHRRYPDARVMGPPGLAAKRPGLAFDPIVMGERSILHDSVSALTLDGAPLIMETVFLHLPSRSLVVADLVFNVETPPSLLTAVLLTATGTRGRLAQSRLWSFAQKDRAAMRASCRRLLAWDFDRLIVAHGNVIQTGAKARLAVALTRTT